MSFGFEDGRDRRGFRRWAFAALLFCGVLFVGDPAGRGASRALAQDGRFLQGLIREIAESQAARLRAEIQRRDAEGGSAARPPAAIPSEVGPTRIPPTRIPPTRIPPNRISPNRISPTRISPTLISPNGGGPDRIPPDGDAWSSVPVRSPEAADFVGRLVQLSRVAAELAERLQRSTRTLPQARQLVPAAYALDASARRLVSRCEGLSSPTVMTMPYQELDLAWRELSFAIRDVPGFPEVFDRSVPRLVIDGDAAAGSITRLLGIAPQFNRRGMHDEFLVTATLLQCLVDDLALAETSRRRGESLARDVRRLRARVLAMADVVEQASYDDLAAEYSEFAADWERRQDGLMELRGPHVDARLDRIRQSVDRLFERMWMPPPRRDRQLLDAAEGLERACGSMTDALTLRSLESLSRREQAEVMQAARELYTRCRSFETMVARDPVGAGVEPAFDRIDAEWEALRRRFDRVREIRPAAIAGMDRQCQAVRDVFGFAGPLTVVVDVRKITAIAASLEGATEYFHADIKRFAGDMQPAEYRRDTMAAAAGMYEQSRELHALASRHGPPDQIRTLARSILTDWETLTDSIRHAGDHGLAGRRANYLVQIHARLAPTVAQLAAALL